MSEFKLLMELVPSPLWWVNPRLLMPKSQWDRIRKQVYADHHHKCGICGREGRLEAHERWEYDDVNFTQRLAGFIALCLPCHRVKHIGHSQLLSAEINNPWVDADVDWPYEEEGVYQESPETPVLWVRWHLGKTQVRKLDKETDNKVQDFMETLIEHFMAVNGCSREEFEEHRSQAVERWSERSRHKEWRLDWGPYQLLIDESRAKNAKPD